MNACAGMSTGTGVTVGVIVGVTSAWQARTTMASPVIGRAAIDTVGDMRARD